MTDFIVAMLILFAPVILGGVFAYIQLMMAKPSQTRPRREPTISGFPR